jgi:hypothetical protein
VDARRHGNRQRRCAWRRLGVVRQALKRPPTSWCPRRRPVSFAAAGRHFQRPPRLAGFGSDVKFLPL